jgi:hypothetical protein
MGGSMMSPSNIDGPMRTGMELFQQHGQVRRTFSGVPGGVHAASESDDPYTASLLQEHVSEMHARLDQGRGFPYPMSRSVPAMFANRTRYHRKLTMLPKGIAVTETSNAMSVDDCGIPELDYRHREVLAWVRAARERGFDLRTLEDVALRMACYDELRRQTDAEGLLDHPRRSY